MADKYNLLENIRRILFENQNYIYSRMWIISVLAKIFPTTSNNGGLANNEGGTLMSSHGLPRSFDLCFTQAVLRGTISHSYTVI
jgi:hypothetical protein